jgi:hypothetical protein
MPGRDVADLTDGMGHEQLDLIAPEVLCQSGQHFGGRYVDERCRLCVQHDFHGRGSELVANPLADMVGVCEVQAGLHPDDDDILAAGQDAVTRDIHPEALALVRRLRPRQDRHVRSGGPVKQGQKRNRDADEQTGEGVEDDDAEQRGQGREKVRTRGPTLDPAEVPGPDPIQALQPDQVAGRPVAGVGVSALQ